MCFDEFADVLSAVGHVEEDAGAEAGVDEGDFVAEAVFLDLEGVGWFAAVEVEGFHFGT